MSEQHYRSPVLGADEKALRDVMLGTESKMESRNIAIPRTSPERHEVCTETRLPAAMVFVDSLESTLAEIQDLARLVDVKLDPIMRRVPSKEDCGNEKIRSEMPPFFEHVSSQLRMIDNEIRTIRRYVESVEF